MLSTYLLGFFSGKLRRGFSRTRTFQTVTSGETVHLDSFDTVQNVSVR